MRSHGLRAQPHKAASLPSDARRQPALAKASDRALAINRGFQILSLGLPRLLEQLAGLGGMFYLLGYWLVVKGFNSRTGQGNGERVQTSRAFSETPLSVHQP